jgi:diaminopimelate epimerase
VTTSKGTPFSLVSGAGNDFIALLDRPVPSAETVRAWCRRGVSIGADGLFSLRRATEGRYVLDYANADGARANLCLNAARCAARLAFDKEPTASSIEIETAAGALTAEPVDETRTAVLVPAPGPGHPMTLQTNGRTYPGRRSCVGVPHFVLWWQPDLDDAPVASLGPILRAHPDLGRGGANVHFVDLDPPAGFRIRSFERGVEAETLACGTGVVAAAACALAEGQLALPLIAATRSGCELHLEAAAPAPDGTARWRLSGDARIVAAGHIRDQATLLPSAP